ncbi:MULTISPECIES: sigma-54 interaction domain-containing protein [Methylotenera]|uniref:sigma-54 interaction domain-containing protein n=1 Tax=Methylotenera TaxID=359407 RepID=UPI0003752F46|nr:MULTISPECIES: sigma-54 dependent transcriptional regulator [Methylotenera]
MQSKPWLSNTELRGFQDDSSHGVIEHPNPSAVSLSIRASALVFNDPKSKKLLALIERVAASDATALIIGETGTGKELIARRLHDLSARRNGPFAAINCGAFSESLVESELFGHEKGSFTGAISAKEGWFESASGGTLFLDEVGDLPLSTQVKLLRVLQEREIVRVGSRKPQKINVRLIAATNVNLEDAVNAGNFRQDLYYRIKVVPIELPPLRERIGDILPLVNHFLKVYTGRLHTSTPHLSAASVHALETYAWPGNIRELENTIHRALLVSSGGVIYPKDLHLPYITSKFTPISVHESDDHFLNVPTTSTEVRSQDIENLLSRLFKQELPNLYELINAITVRKAYDHCNNNQVHTAKLLGISRNILRARLKELNLIA